MLYQVISIVNIDFDSLKENLVWWRENPNISIVIRGYELKLDLSKITVPWMNIEIYSIENIRNGEGLRVTPA